MSTAFKAITMWLQPACMISMVTLAYPSTIREVYLGAVLCRWFAVLMCNMICNMHTKIKRSNRRLRINKFSTVQCLAVFTINVCLYRNSRQVIADGYTAHLNVLTASDQIRPPVGNVRLSMRKGCYGFPVNAHLCGGNGKNPVRKTTSLPQHTSSTSSSRQSPALARPMIAVSEAGNTVVTTGLNQNPLL